MSEPLPSPGLYLCIDGRPHAWIGEEDELSDMVSILRQRISTKRGVMISQDFDMRPDISGMKISAVE